eukprot:jgi/Pico_ML_1/51538/g217.t1
MAWADASGELARFEIGDGDDVLSDECVGFHVSFQTCHQPAPRFFPLPRPAANRADDLLWMIFGSGHSSHHKLRFGELQRGFVFRAPDLDGALPSVSIRTASASVSASTGFKASSTSSIRPRTWASASSIAADAIAAEDERTGPQACRLVLDGNAEDLFRPFE